MALQRNANGQYVIRSKTEAVRALTMMQNLQDEITELKKEYGLDEMEMDATELKRAATAYCANNGVEILKLPKVNRYARLIKAVASKKWIGTKDDMPDDADKGAKPLKSIVSKEVWMKITKRVPDPELIDEAVAEGLVTLREIEPAYVETFKSPYLGIYEGDVE